MSSFVVICGVILYAFGAFLRLWGLDEAFFLFGVVRKGRIFSRFFGHLILGFV